MSNKVSKPITIVIAHLNNPLRYKSIATKIEKGIWLPLADVLQLDTEMHQTLRQKDISWDFFTGNHIKKVVVCHTRTYVGFSRNENVHSHPWYELDRIVMTD